MIQTTSPTSNSHPYSTPSAQHSAETINSFFTRNEKKPQEDELTIDETVRCLATEVGRPTNEKKGMNMGDVLDWSSPKTPSAAKSLGSPAVREIGPPILPHEAESFPAEDNGRKLTPSNPAHHHTDSAASSDAEESSGSGSGYRRNL
jgi:phosphatidylserine decarboxylase